MIGLLRKDIYLLISAYKKNLVLVFLLYAVLAVTLKQLFLLAMLIWMMGFYSLGTFTMDDTSGWDCYAATLPVSAGQIVGARFLITLGTIGLGALFALIVGAVLHLMDRANFFELACTAAVTTGLALCSMGLLLPAAYKWGVEIARNTFMLLCLLIFLTPFLLDPILDLKAALVALLDQLSPTSLGLGALGLGFAVFALGFLLSCTAYQKKGS